MSKSLILFSGGVESTALLSISKPNDILITVDNVYQNYTSAYNRDSIDAIAQEYNKKINYCTVELPIAVTFHVHQMWYLMAVAGLWAVADPDIAEVWCGRNSAEPGAELKPFIDEMMSKWAVMYPKVEFRHPLDHLTKKEQWDIIPVTVQKHVHSCVHQTDCGLCPKCVEYAEMLK